MFSVVGEGRIFAVVLAAGKSERFGKNKDNKLFAKFSDGKTMLEKVVDAVKDTDVAGVIIVTNGNINERVRDIFSGNSHMPELVENNTGEMTSSFMKGVARAKELNADAVILLLGDQPFINPKTIEAVINAWRKTNTLIIHPTYSGRPVHPVIFSKGLFDQILNISLEGTLKEFVRAHTQDAIFLSVDGVVSSGREFADVDIQADLENASSSGR